MCQFAAPPGHRRTSAPVSPMLASFVAIIDVILEADKQVHVKQLHMAVRIRERLGDEHGYRGGQCGEPAEGGVHATDAWAKPRSGRFRRSRRGTSTARRYAFAIFSWICRIRMRVSSSRIRPKTRKPSFLDSYLAPFAFLGGVPPKAKWKDWWATRRRHFIVPLPVAGLCELERIDRIRRTMERRIRLAQFSVTKSLDTCDFMAMPILNKSLVLELARCEWIDKFENT